MDALLPFLAQFKFLIAAGGIPSVSSAIDLAVGRQIASRRMALGLDVESLAAKLGIEAETLLAFEEGSRRVNALMLFKLTEILEVPPRYFYELLKPGRKG